MKPKLLFKDNKEYEDAITFCVNKAIDAPYSMCDMINLIQELFNDQETINGDNLYVQLNFVNDGKEITLKSTTSIKYKDKETGELINNPTP